MFASMPAVFRIPLVVLLLALNIFAHVLPLFVVAVLKLVVPIPAWRHRCSLVLAAIAESWIGFNNRLFDAFTRIEWGVEVAADLRHDRAYLVLCNHQSWVDIPVLQRVCNQRIPLLRFFLKSELIWVPLLGLAWWALDFPFMKRYSRSHLQRHPELKGRDREVARRACEKFRSLPVAMMTFAEGTRFTAAKHVRQAPPYTHLLRARAGGVAYVFDAMGDLLHSVLDVTIAYPDGPCSMMDVIAGRVREIRVHVQEVSVAESLLGDYDNDPALRARLQRWLNDLWQLKDARLQGMLGEESRELREQAAGSDREPEVRAHSPAQQARGVDGRGMDFRDATAADINDIVCLVELAYRGENSRVGWTTEADLLDGQRVDREAVAEVIGRAQSRVLLAERGTGGPNGHALLACCHLEKQGDACYFGMFSVRPDLQGNGAGSRMLAEAERIARDEWLCRSMRMTVIDVRDDLIGWYQRRGYRRTGEYRPFPYGDERFGIPRRDDLRFEWLDKTLLVEELS